MEHFCWFDSMPISSLALLCKSCCVLGSFFVSRTSDDYDGECSNSSAANSFLGHSLPCRTMGVQTIDMASASGPTTTITDTEAARSSLRYSHRPLLSKYVSCNEEGRTTFFLILIQSFIIVVKEIRF